ncbi:hypothetical protein E2K72_25905, partial [Escherichia coli]
MLHTLTDQVHFHRRKTCAPVQDGIEHHGQVFVVLIKLRFLIFSILTLLLRFNHRPERIFFAVEKITQLENEEINNGKE